MSAIETAIAVADALNRLKCNYLMVGAMASNFYSIARSTSDVDFVVELELTPLETVLGELRPRFELDPQVSFETVTGATRYLLTDRQSHFIVDLFALGDDEHSRARLDRRHAIELEGHRVWIPSAEDVIITKLRWARQALRRKDEDDIRDVVAVSGPRLDWDYIHRWCDKHGTRPLLDQIRASLPPL